MTKLLMGLSFLLSVSTFASTSFKDSSLPKIDEKGVCEVHALKKMVAFAMDNKVEDIDVHSFRLVTNDKRALSPSHYSWYELEVMIDNSKVTIGTSVQKNRLPSGECI